MLAPPLILASLMLCGSVRTVSASAQAPDWMGSFGTAAAPLEIVIRLEQAGGDWIGRIDIPSYGVHPKLQLPAHRLERQLRLGVSRFISPWLQFAVRHDPGSELRRIGDIPALALNGSRDAQVAAAPNLGPSGGPFTRQGTAA